MQHKNDPPPADPVSMNDLPTAERTPRRRTGWLWLIPVVSLAIVAVLVDVAYGRRGIAVTVVFSEGHGLKPEDVVRYRGIEVGVVKTVRLTPLLDAVAVTIGLHQSARDLAREGSRFWVVRPRIDLSGAAGLETILGAKYISVIPGQGEYTDRFTGLDSPPYLKMMAPGGLRVTLVSAGKGDLRPGAPVRYRQVEIGKIVSVSLSRDANAVEAAAYIRPGYISLIRENTRFWKDQGARVEMGIGGFSIRLESLRALITGGISISVPPDPGNAVSQNERFPLFSAPKPEWLKWKPHLDMTAAAGKDDLPRPLPVTAKLTEKTFFGRKKQIIRRGWVLPVANGFLGPADLLQPPENGEGFLFYIDGDFFPLIAEPRPAAPGVGLSPLNHPFPPFPETRIRSPKAPEDLRLAAGDADNVRFVRKGDLTVTDKGWIVESPLPAGASLHGAPAVATTDGALVGIALSGKKKTRIIPLPKRLPGR